MPDAAPGQRGGETAFMTTLSQRDTYATQNAEENAFLENKYTHFFGVECCFTFLHTFLANTDHSC